MRITHVNRIALQSLYGLSDVHAADGGLDDAASTLRIVGIDEASAARGEVSWVSPIARALMKAGQGDVVTLRTPNGARRIEVVKIAYEES